jgi:hypothetical protein
LAQAAAVEVSGTEIGPRTDNLHGPCYVEAHLPSPNRTLDR